MKLVWVVFPLVLVAAITVAMVVWRQLDHQADRAAWRQLADTARHDIAVFDPSMIEDLPEPARRYFNFAIRPGTPIRTAVVIVMSGEIGQGTRVDHTYRPMRAEQILAPPHGLVWRVTAGSLSGSDGAMPDRSWTRFWLFRTLPVVRVDGPDHQRSAFGRVIAEAAIWVPASLLPSDNVDWQLISDDTARARVRFGDFVQAVDITVDPDGAPVEFVIQRWSNENPERVFREQPFGGVASDFQWFGGYRLPTRVEGGNHFGTPDHFPFYRANVLSIEPVS